MWQALTSLSVCFNMYDFGLDATGLTDAIADFWLNNPAVKDVQPVQSVARQGSSAARWCYHPRLSSGAGRPVPDNSRLLMMIFRFLPLFNLQAVKDVVDRVMGPIEDAVAEVENFVKTLKDFFDDLSFRRRLEELTPAEMVHARGLKEQARRQLEQVRGRLLHADNDDAHASTKERLLGDVHRRLEVHLAERKLVARQLGSELVSISSLKASIKLELDSRLLIEGQIEKNYHLPLATKDESFEKIIPLYPTPFFVKLAGSFSVDASLGVQLEADLKALVHLVVDGMGVDFNLATGAQNPVVFSKGDWTQTITLEVLYERRHIYSLPIYVFPKHQLLWAAHSSSRKERLRG